MSEYSEREAGEQIQIKKVKKIKIVGLEERTKGIKRSETGVGKDLWDDEQVGEIDLKTKRNSYFKGVVKRATGSSTLKNLVKALNEPKEIEDIREEDHGSYSIQEKTRSIRVETPKFQKVEQSEFQQLKDLCDKLKFDQNLMREEINMQRKMLKQFNISLVPSRASSFMKIRVSNKGSPLSFKGLGETDGCSLLGSPKSIRFNSSLKNSPKVSQDLGKLPFLFGPNSEKKMSRNSPSKYNRDKPVISKRFKLLKDVFTVNE